MAVWDKLEVHIQPFYNIKHQKIVGAEALIRSKLNKKLAAQDILEGFKAQGKLLDFDIFMVENLCRTVAEINSTTNSGDSNNAIKGKPLNINISPETLNEPGVGRRVASIIKRYKVQESIVIELNEGCIFENEIVEDNIHTFVKMGIMLSLDDFNMTNKSLMALSKYNVKEVKFKQTGLGEFSSKDKIILKYLSGMCNELNLNIVIEGIETITQFEAIKQLGIETIQGFIISKPIPFELYTTESVKTLSVIQ